MNTIVTYKIKGFVYTAGMVEPDECEKGFWNWSLYLVEGEGIATSKREARAFIKEGFFEAFNSGIYQDEYLKMQANTQNK